MRKTKQVQLSNTIRSYIKENVIILNSHKQSKLVRLALANKALMHNNNNNNKRQEARHFDVQQVYL
jgi:hypothetical protein